MMSHAYTCRCDLFWVPGIAARFFTMQYPYAPFLRFLALLILGLFTQMALALTPFVIKDIRVEGLQRVEAGTVFASLPVRVGDTYSDEVASASIKALFGLGLFNDVRISVDGAVLMVIVSERPIIGSVTFAGTKEFDKEILVKALKDIGLAEGRPFDKALADKAEQELKRQYINRSMYAAEIVTTVTPVDGNRVNLSFAVSEGETAKIKSIKIIGAVAFSESTLMALFDSDTGGWLSWYTKSDRYARTKLNADIESLRTYYLSRGYLEFTVDSTQVTIAPNKQDIGITINITEGERFVVAKVKLAGNYLEKEEQFRALVAIRPGEPYNVNEVAQTTKAFTDFYGNFGYAFSQVEAQTTIDRSTNQVEITLRGDPSRRVYVRRINIAGNDTTRDEVVRREFRQMESAWYDGEKIRASRNRVDRLGYFKEVSLDTVEVPGFPDQADLLVTVVEKPTGSLSFGFGYSSADGAGLSFAFKQDNVFGSGSALGVEVNTSKLNTTYVLSTTDPYFTQDGISRSFDLYYRTTRPYADINSYALKNVGTSVRFGVPFSESDTVYFGAGYDVTTIEPGSMLPPVYVDFANDFGYTASAVPLTIGWSRDTRDSGTVPSSGRLLKANAEWSVAGDLTYLRGIAQAQQFFPLTKRVTLAFNSELALGVPTNGQTYPLFKNYYAGGVGSVRGFETGSLTTAAQRTLGSVATGGTKKLIFNAEVLSPLPGGGNDRTLRMYAFLDAGGLYGSGEAIAIGDLRSSVGVGISYISPVGPLRLSFAKPISQFDSDKIQSLQFSMGTSF
jgi:outer membrane protein insertion porin family